MELHRPLATYVNEKGFTIFEMLIVTGILAIILAIGIPISWNFYLDYELVYEQKTLNSLLGYARNLSMVNSGEAAHGLYIDSSNFVVFEGNSYASRNVNADKPFPRSSAITITGPVEQWFLPLSGQTSSSTFGVSNGRKTFTTYVNSEGRIEW